MSHDTDKLIRQLSLVAFLMAERRPLTAREIKSVVEGYSEMSDEAFARRFYSDRSELVALGVPLHSQRDEFTGEELYTLGPSSTSSPSSTSTTRSWPRSRSRSTCSTAQFAYAEPLRLALQNLALGRPTQLEAAPESGLRVEVRDPDYSDEMSGRLTKLEGAISKQRTVRFTYWSISRNRTRERTVNPYALLPEAGSWYLIGRDLDEEDERTFRVSRIIGDIRFATRRERDFRMPEDTTPPASGAASPGSTARIRARPRSSSIRTPPGGWSAWSSAARSRTASFTTPYSRLDLLAGWVLRQEGRARPLSPPELVDEVDAGLDRVLERHEGEPTKPPRPKARQEAEPLERPAGPLRAGALRRPPGPARPSPRALRRRDRRRPSPRRSSSSASTFRPTSSTTTSSSSTSSTSAAGATRSTRRSTATTCASTRSCSATRSGVPPRLTPLEARAIRLALEFVGPMIAAEAQTPLERVRRKLEETFGEFASRRKPTEARAPRPEEEQLIRTLSAGHPRAAARRDRVHRRR